MPCQKLPSESCDGDRTDDDFILGEGLLKPMPICFPPGAVERIRHDLEDDDVVMHRRSLGLDAALGGRACESGDAAEPACQLFPHVRVFMRSEGPSFVVRNRQQDLNEMHGSPHSHRAKRDGVAHHFHWRDAVLPDVAGLT